MYPSRVPFLYVLHLLIIACAIMLGIYVGVVILGEPLTLLLILALNFLPEVPLVPEPDAEEGSRPGEYDGGDNPVGFHEKD